MSSQLRWYYSDGDAILYFEIIRYYFWEFPMPLDLFELSNTGKIYLPKRTMLTYYDGLFTAWTPHRRPLTFSISIYELDWFIMSGILRYQHKEKL